MITKPTVFILGAGASAEYKLPIGGRLIRDIADGLSETGFLRGPAQAAGHRDGDIDDFRRKLIGSRLTSIDAFLEQNEAEYQGIGKVAIGGSILFRESDALQALSESSPDDDWLGYVWNVMRASATVDTFRNNQVTFVTFNYDRLVEYYFAEVLAHAFNLSAGEAGQLRDRSFDVIHLYGEIAGRAFGSYSRQMSHRVLAEAGSGIRIIHDRVPSGDDAFERAYEAFREASQTCMLGFGYHADNLSRLRLKELMNNRTLSGTAYGMGTSEVSMAKKLVGRGFTAGAPSEKAEAFLRQRVILE